jgi:hypothetical protein
VVTLKKGEYERGESVRSLTILQEKFVMRYFLHGVGWRAAREAGYSGSAKTLGIMATRNLQKPSIIEALAKHRAEFVARIDLDVEYVLQELKKVVDRFIGEPEYVQHGLRALEDIGKYLGMFVERREVHGSVEVQRVEVVKDYGEPTILEGVASLVVGEDDNSS